jgi:hypothetical protein
MTGTIRVALCPHPPLLLRELCGRVDAVPELREACRAAVADLVAQDPAEVVVVGPADRAGRLDDGLAVDVRRFGSTGPRTPPGTGLPQSLGVGRRLLDEAGWRGAVSYSAVSWDAGPDELTALADELLDRPGVTLLLLGDGSARRGEKAPGFLDERAFGFDDAVANALTAGDPGPLRDLDPGLAGELMVGGRSVLRLLGRLGDRLPPTAAELTHRDDPYGVSYFVARWDL